MKLHLVSPLTSISSFHSRKTTAGRFRLVKHVLASIPVQILAACYLPLLCLTFSGLIKTEWVEHSETRRTRRITWNIEIRQTDSCWPMKTPMASILLLLTGLPLPALTRLLTYLYACTLLPLSQKQLFLIGRLLLLAVTASCAATTTYLFLLYWFFSKIGILAYDYSLTCFITSPYHLDYCSFPNNLTGAYRLLLLLWLKPHI